MGQLQLQAPLLRGFALMLGLIVAVGAQNAFLLAHAVHRRYALRIAALCTLIDAIMVSAGLAGATGLMTGNAWLGRGLAAAGAAFLMVYGARAFRATLSREHLDATAALAGTAREAVVGTLAVSLLNPHVYIDTLLLIGGVGTQYAGDKRWLFGVGAVCGSAAWFGLVSIGGRYLAPVLGQPAAWRVVNAAIGVIMWLVAASLISSFVA